MAVQMSPEHQKMIEQLGMSYNSTQDPTLRNSYHNAAEQIRAKYGFSGGSDGSQMISLSTGQPMNQPVNYGIPGSPQIPTANPQNYQSQYQDMINQSLSAIRNMPQFSYNPANDPSYQAYVQQQQALGQTAFNNQMGTLSTMTGGRPNSWGQSVASQAQNTYNQQAASAMPQFESLAYDRYKGDYNMKMDQLNMILNLDDREYGRYKDQTQYEWDTYNAQYNQFKDSLEEKRKQMNDAYTRTQMTGYVSNEDSVILGLPSGTPSFEVAQSKREMDNWFTQQDYKMKQEMEMMKVKLQQEQQLIKFRESFNKTSTGVSGGTGASIPVTKADLNERDKMIESYNKFVKSTEFLKLPDNEKKKYIESVIAGVIEKVETKDKKGVPLMNPDIANGILKAVMESPEYFKYYHKSSNPMIDNMRKNAK